MSMQEIQYGHELHAFLDQVPAALKGGRFVELRAQCQVLMVQAPQTRMQQALADLHTALDGKTARSYVLSRYEDAMRAYEQWLATWRKERTAPASLSPLIIARTLFHAGMAVLAVCMYQFVLTRAQASGVLLTLLTIFGTLEITRRYSERWNQFLVEKFFKPIARPRELHKTNSATWYLLALCSVTPFFSRDAVITGILVLGFGDPAAAWIGKRYGKLKLYRNKSVAGSLAFFVTSMLVACAFLFKFSQPSLAGIFAAALAGTIAELYTTRLDDNLTVPTAATLAAAIFMH
jgi:dolichol kinase